MPRHPLSTGLFLSSFSLAAGLQEMLLQTVDENQTLQQRTNSLGSQFSPSAPHPFSLHSPPGPGRGDVNGRKPLVQQLCSLFSPLWCPGVVSTAGGQHKLEGEQDTRIRGDSEPAQSSSDCPSCSCHRLRSPILPPPLASLCLWHCLGDKVTFALPHLIGKVGSVN